MKDPFPIAPIPALSEWVRPFAEKYNLTVLPLHIHEVLAAALFYTFIHLVISPWISKKYFPKYYPTDRGKRVSWDSHVVSLVQSTLINIMALYCMWADEERKTMDWQARIWGYTGASGLVQSMAAGYFVWDFVTTLSFLDVFGLGLLAHATSALLVYSFGYRPFLNYYASVFILYELSTPFLNVHWFCDKLGMTGTKLQLYNGIVLLFTFFSARLIWGVGQSGWVFYDMYRALYTAPNTEYMSVTPVDEKLPGSEDIMMFAKEIGPLPVWLAAIYVASNLTLTALNFIWFGKMIKAVRKRFVPTKGKEEPVQGDKPAVGSGTAANIGEKVDGVRRRNTIPEIEIKGDLGDIQ
ncbi:hypothetical protein VMCG_01393 [Cytospora schulzeri]|uniref:TLC domain-containing protein n=1 Tax=Cytospora schulzeri TaxID=448051 RepID=A0A423X6V7_9PEZI|nr:hypothetical protein VMCG_01393 [Valsa malicola]